MCACVGMYVLDGSVCLCRDVCAGWECACVGMYKFQVIPPRGARG